MVLPKYGVIKQAYYIGHTEKRRKQREKTITEVPMAQKSDRDVTYGLLLFLGQTPFIILTNKCSGKTLRQPPLLHAPTMPPS